MSKYVVDKREIIPNQVLLFPRDATKLEKDKHINQGMIWK